MNRFPILPVALSALGASVLTLVGQDILRSDTGSHVKPLPAVPLSPPEELADLREKLGRIESLLDELSLPAVQAQRTPVASSAPVEDLGVEDQVVTILEEFNTRLGRIEMALKSGIRSIPHDPVDRRRPVDIASIQDFLGLARIDRKAAEREIKLMTQGEVIERFGFPDRVEAVQGQSCDTWWCYNLLSPSGDPYSPLEISFLNGFALYFEVHDPPE